MYTGSDLKEHRLRMGLTQAQMGAKLGVTGQSVWAMERDDATEIRPKYALKLLEVVAAFEARLTALQSGRVSDAEVSPVTSADPRRTAAALPGIAEHASGGRGYVPMTAEARSARKVATKEADKREHYAALRRERNAARDTERPLVAELHREARRIAAAITGPDADAWAPYQIFLAENTYRGDDDGYEHRNAYTGMAQTRLIDDNDPLVTLPPEEEI